MNTMGRLKRAIYNPKLFARGINRAYHQHGGLKSENKDGIDVFAADWDTLIVLDACRYDMFETVNYLDGVLTSKQSKGSSTTEWLHANFHSRDLRDTVYVTANPQLERNRDCWEVNLHETVNVWLNEGWDEETGTVLAETMTDIAIKMHDRFPNKRLVIHYMQPHYPFVPSDTMFDKEHLHRVEDPIGSNSDKENVWNQKFLGDLSTTHNELWEMYMDNLKYVLKNLGTLLDEVSGKPVITSDHGNYVGERASPIPIREYGHPRGLYDDTLTCVPWFECDYKKRRQIIAGSDPSADSNIDSKTVSKRLRDLGYRD